MGQVRDSFRDTIMAEFLNQFRALSPMTPTEFGTLLNLVRCEFHLNFICHHMDRKGWIYHTRNGKRMSNTDIPRKTDTIHYDGPQYTFNKETVYRILVSE